LNAVARRVYAENLDEHVGHRPSDMSGLLGAFCVYWLHCWWCCRTTNSPALKRSWPYPRAWKNNADLYRRPCRGRRHL